MKTTTNLLTDLLSALDTNITRKSSAAKQLLAVKAEADGIIARATGPDDDEALAKLSGLASQETLINRQLALLDQERRALDARLLDEASRVRANLTIEMDNRRAALETKLEAGLAAFYPSPRQLKRVLETITRGEHLSPVFAAIDKANLRFRIYVPRDQSAADYARGILNAANRALALLAEK